MPRPRLHDDALRARLLEVASEVISARGTAGLTLRDVARTAGTSASAVYALFGSREALVAAVSDEAFRRFAAHLAAAGRTADPRRDLLALGLAYRRSALDDPHFYRVMFDSPGTGAQDPDRAPLTDAPAFGTLRDAVARVMAASGAPPGAVAAVAQDAAVGMWGLVHGLVLLELAGVDAGSAPASAARYERFLVAAASGLLAAPPQGSGHPVPGQH